MDAPIDIAAYLERIRYPDSPRADLRSLQTLHRHHVFHVPFENLDIYLGKPISLAPADLFDKIVRRRRGGYCFELNGLFELLLEAIGFQVYSTAARVLFDAAGIPPRSHRLLIATLEKDEWLVDVGFGAYGLFEPILLQPDIEHRQYGERFRLVQHSQHGYLFQTKIKGRWIDQYGFAKEPYLTVDFTFPNFYHSHSPDSVFTRKRICQLPTAEGRKKFVDMTLTLPANGRSKKTVATGEEHYRALLRTHFDLDIG